jgi:F-type H+-transporting ATPase subunit delta
VKSGSSKIDLVAVRYAAVLLDMAAEAKAVDKVESDFVDLEKMVLESQDLQTMIDNPLISRTQQEKAIIAIAKKAKFNKLTVNFLGILAHNRRLNKLSAVVRAFKDELSARRGEVQAYVETAYVLTNAQTKALQDQLSKAMGTSVALNVEENSELLGGMVVTVGSTMIDDSVRCKLDKLKRAMGAGSNDQQLKEVG